MVVPRTAQARAGLAPQAGHRIVPPLAGLFVDCLRREGCRAGCEGQYALADGIIFPAYNGRVMFGSYRPVAGLSPFARTFFVAPDGRLVSQYLGGQQARGPSQQLLS